MERLRTISDTSSGFILWALFLNKAKSLGEILAYLIWLLPCIFMLREKEKKKTHQTNQKRKSHRRAMYNLLLKQ